MANRRAADAHVDQLPSGHYRARLVLGGHRYSQTFASRLQAAAWLADLRVRHEAGTLTSETANAPPQARTVGQQLDAFLLAVRGTVSDKTHGEYARNARHHLAALRPLPLVDLTADVIRAHRLALREGTAPYVTQPLEPRTLRNVIAVLRRALELAVEDGLLTRNVARGLKPLKVAPSPQRVLSRQEQRALLAAAAARGDRLVGLWWVALRTGARLSELLGLTWEDVDLQHGIITIWRQLDKPQGGRPTWKPTTKTAASVAPVYLPRSALVALQQHQARQDGEKLRQAGLYRDFGLVFATRRGTALTQRHVLDYWQRACRLAGVPIIPFHGSRHSAASSYIAAGVPLPEVSQILRHASPAVTAALYAHAISRYGRAAGDALDKFLDDEPDDEPRDNARDQPDNRGA